MDRWDFEEGPSTNEYTHDYQTVPPVKSHEDTGITLYTHTKKSLHSGHEYCDICIAQIESTCEMEIPVGPKHERGIFVVSGKGKADDGRVSKPIGENNIVYFWHADDDQKCKIVNTGKSDLVIVYLDLKVNV